MRHKPDSQSDLQTEYMNAYLRDMSRIEMTPSQKAQTLAALRKARNEEMRKANRSAQCRLNRHHAQTTMPAQRKRSRAALVLGAGLAAAALAFAIVLARIDVPSPAPSSDPVATMPDDRTQSSQTPSLCFLNVFRFIALMNLPIFAVQMI